MLVSAVLCFGFTAFAAANEAYFSLSDVSTDKSRIFETVLSADSEVAAFVAHLEFDEGALEFRNAAVLNASAEISVNYQQGGKVTLAYLAENGSTGELIDLSFRLKDAEAFISLSLEQVIGSDGKDIYVCSAKGASVSLSEETAEISTNQKISKSTEALTEHQTDATDSVSSTSEEAASDYIYLPATVSGNHLLILTAAGGFTIALGIGAIAFILGRGTNKTNGKDKYEKDT